MKLPQLAVNRPVTVLMGIAVIVVLGLVSLSQLPIDLLPNIEAPIVAIQTGYPNAGPYEVENLVTRPIEEALGAINKLKSVRSTSSRGTSVVIAEFDWGTDMDFASLDVRERIDLVKDFLPDDAENPILVKFDPTAMPIMELVITGDRPLYELRTIAEDTIKNRLERLGGVASVSVSGGQVREIHVELHPGLMQAHGVSLDAIAQTLRMANTNMPAGDIVDSNLTYTLRTTGEFSDVDQIRAVRIPTATGGFVRLSDVAEVIDGFKELTQLSRLDGKDAVILSIQKESSANSLQVADAVRASVSQLNERLGQNVSLVVAQDNTTFIVTSVNNVTANALVGAILAVIVLLIFLRSIRTTFVIGLAIPISVLATFVLMFFSKTSINMISLGGLALGIGMLVDNGIVVLENIFRHREEGADIKTAAHLGAQEVGTAITASTLTTVSVFLPVVFISGIAAEIFRDMVLTVTFSLGASLVIALTVVPMLASRLLGNKAARQNVVQRVIGDSLSGVQQFYGGIIRWVLQKRAMTIVVSVVLFLASLGLLPIIGMEFMPSMDQGELAVSVSLPRGSQLADTNAVIEAIEDYASSLGDVGLVYSSVGGAGRAHSGSVGVRLVPFEERVRSTPEVVEDLRSFGDSIPGVTIAVRSQDMAAGMLGGAPVQIDLRGDDFEELGMYAERLQSLVAEVPGVVEVTNSRQESDPEVQVVIHRDKVAEYGVSIGQIASSLRSAVSGTTVTRYRTGGQEIDVTARLGKQWRESARDIESIPISTPRGTVPLGELAALQYGQSPVSIGRTEGSRIVSITGQISGRELSEVIAEVEQVVNNFSVPSDVLVGIGGETEMMTDSFGQLGIAMVLGILLVYMVLASQFESLAQPLIIMFTLPMAVIGVVGGLLIFGVTFNIVAFIGAIMLAGIVVNNAIVLIDYINQLRNRGVDRYEALVRAGELRLRPILMTTLTTVLAMIPLALGLSEGAEMQQPIAVVVIGGLLTSTMLTLLVIPVAYSLLDDFTTWLRGLFSGRKGTTEAPNASQEV